MYSAEKKWVVFSDILLSQLSWRRICFYRSKEKIATLKKIKRLTISASFGVLLRGFILMPTERP